jgi:hypothetical protein
VRDQALRLLGRIFEALPFQARRYLLARATQFLAARFRKRQSPLLIHRGPMDQAATVLSNRLRLTKSAHVLPKALNLVKENQARLWLGAHLICNRFVIRLLTERGLRLSLVAMRQHLNAADLPDGLELIEPSQDVYLRIRSHLKRHRTVIFTLDQWQPFHGGVALDLPPLPAHISGVNYHINQQALQAAHQFDPNCHVFLPTLNDQGEIEICFEALDKSNPGAFFADRLKSCVLQNHGLR